MKSLGTTFGILAALALGSLAIYGQTRHFEFISFDDNLYVYDNPVVQTGLTAPNVVWAFTATHAANWHPVTWLSHMADMTVFGVRPGAHHLMNVAYHILASWLLFGVLRSMTSRTWPSAIVAGLFAVHPAHVESVAWIAERKDVLSAVFWMLTMWAYARYAAVTSMRRYVLVIVCFAVGLMAKPMLMTLPFVLLLLDYWPLQRISWTADDLPGFARRAARLTAEKLPLLALTVISCLLTVEAQKQGGAIRSLEAVPLPLRLVNADSSVVSYLISLAWPARLGMLYPFDTALPVAWTGFCAALIVLVTGAALMIGRTHRFAATGWLWYLGTLAPVIGLIQVGAQARADRYTYLPSIGLFIVAVWGVDAWLARVRVPKTAVVLATSALFLALGIAAFRQTSYWRNSETLYVRTLSVTKNNYVIHQNLCHELARKGRLDDAYAQCAAAVKVVPVNAAALNSLAAVVITQGRYAEGLEYLKRAAQRAPDNALVHVNSARAYLMLGELDAAAAELRQAEPPGHSGPKRAELAPMYVDLGAAYAAAGQRPAAVAAVEEALRLNPNLVAAQQLKQKLSDRRPAP